MKKNSYRKDILRTIKNGKKRFISILIIVTLGVVMSAGLRAACVDLRESADAFMDEQDLYDIMVQSTLGLTSDDVSVLSELSGVEEAEGGYSETVYLSGETHESVMIKTFTEGGLNQPYLINGTLPESANEIAVTETYLENSGLEIGDTLTIEEIEDDEDDEEDDDDATFYYTEFVITATVQDPADINNPDSSTAFRDTSTTDYTFFVAECAVNSDIYTAVYLTVTDAKALNCYSDEYKALVASVVSLIEAEVKTDREQARTDEILKDAEDEIADAEDEMNEAFDEADEEIAEAEEELADARAELDEGWEEYYDGLAQIEDAEDELEEGRAALEEEEESAWAQLAQARSSLEESLAELEENETALTEQLEQVNAGIVQLEAVISMLEAQIGSGSENDSSDLETDSSGSETGSDDSETDISVMIAQYEAQLAELEAAKAELEAALAQIEAGKEQIEEAAAELDASEALMLEEFAAAREEIEDGEAEIKEAKAELADALVQLEEGEEEYADGLAEFEDSVAEYEEEKADAADEIADARAELEDIEAATWYVSDRNSLSGYANVESDSGAIEAIGNYFPVIFLAVAVLISLTTITRMVEEERGLIGTYKALGFTNAEIRRKYLIYSLLACLGGSILGELGAFFGLPAIVFIIFGVMYYLPGYVFTFDVLYGLLGPAVFFIGVGFATWYACRRALKQRPAILMRPKAPKAGSRVFLEKIGFIWKRLSFLNKVTARNLFRYKKRLTMTVVGIAGCTGLLIFGFSIKDTVADLVDRQYEDTYKYDLMAVATDNDELLEYIDDSGEISEYLSVRIDTVTVGYGDSTMSVQIFVIPDEYADELTNYVYLETKSKNALSLDAGDILMTYNVGQYLGFSAGETVSVQDLTLAKGEVTVTALVMNYLGNNIYMTASTYEEVFGKEYEANGILANFADEDLDTVAWAQTLAKEDSVTSAVATQQLEDEFSIAFILMDMVVYIVILMAAALAFVVLFTLSTTNISEREREIATIKVLGFHDKEVHLYVNKEMIILTIIGIIPGLVLGYFLAHGMTSILKMQGLYFAVTIHPVSYIFAILLTLVFALIVQRITNRVLNKVDPVEALKSIE